MQHNAVGSTQSSVISQTKELLWKEDKSQKRTLGVQELEALIQSPPYGESNDPHAKYERNRQKAIKDGTWNPRKAREPVREPTELDWAWAAGYLEGEGSFGFNGSSLRVRADSVDREPIIRLLDIFGGGFSDGVTKTGIGKPLYRWSLASKKAKPVLEILLPMLSARRQNQIRNALIAFDRR